MPLFVLIALGWLLVHWRHWPESITEAINRLVFRVALPAMLFCLMYDFSNGRPMAFG
ncbi:AEC family transporter [Candidatus Erwinia dacicola]|uniref:Membrane transport family protein n=1 Tax=Candidatus Erwinia dacicola TaxID=252393 RepID=A0A328TVS3_9GAMM|nr:AEC family transporter [Candidatus Erwinia dacicola]NJD00605.1 hypothetical protein [Candidatus Erwinia dacicola]NJD86055.1 hypothetical protein [Candidatus Erwinia dacicola]RAP71894.1 membrane transport family protein [Candidatus Erwinia dacicola]